MLYLSLSISYASLNDSLYSYYPFNSNLTDIMGRCDMSYTGDETYSSGIVGNAYVADGSNDYIDTSDNCHDNLNSVGLFTFSYWLDPDSIGNDYMYLNKEGAWYINTINSNDMCYDLNAGGVLISSPALDGFNHFTVTYNGSHQRMYINGSLVNVSLVTPFANRAGSTMIFDNGYDPETYTNRANGKVDELYIYNRTLSDSEVYELFNNTLNNITYPFGSSPPPSDTDSPSITDINQDPSNATVTNVLTNHLYINATITDVTGIDEVYLNLTRNNSYVYINGTLKANLTYFEDNTSGDVYNWYLDETDLFSGTYNLDPDVIEVTDHLNTTIQGLNTWLKVRFFNVSNSVQQSFIEYYSENATGTGEISEYYYCNSNYSTGNPTLSQWCTVFYNNYNNLDYSHIHKYGKSKHKILPLGINITSGMINDVYVTPVSYILKRGTPLGDLVFYVNTVTRTDTTQLSISNGNSYTNQAYTVDSHIHQVRNLESINYQICANDTLSNFGCSIWYFDIIEFPLLPPNTVSFRSPIDDTYTSNRIEINHTESFSSSGQSITKYDYYYSVEGENSYNLLGTNNHPNTNFSWDVTNILNNEYRIKVITTDSLNYTSESYTSNFTLTHSYTVDQQLLSNIESYLSLIYGVFNVLPLMIFYIALLWFAYKIRTTAYLSGLGLLFVTYLMDFYMVYYFYTNLVYGNVDGGNPITQFVWIFGVGLIVLILVKTIMLIQFRKLNRSRVLTRFNTRTR